MPSCAVCRKCFKKWEVVHSSSCGQLLHSQCIWQWRHKDCPCCLFDPRTYEVHLKIDESDQITKTEDIDITLVTAKDKIVHLQDQVEELKTQFLQLQKQFTVTEQSSIELMKNITAIRDTETDFMEIHRRYVESLEFRKMLEDGINKLFIRNECKADESKEKILEFQSTKAEMDSKQMDITDGIQNEKTNILEKRMKHISNELENEIKRSTQLAVENMELQCRIENLLNAPEKNKEQPITKINTTENSANIKNKNHTQTNPTQNREIFKTNAVQNSKTANILKIKEFPLERLIMPLEVTIILLASKMNLYISKDDLIDVQLVINKNKKSAKAQIIVEFKSVEIKNKFVVNSAILKNYPQFKSICIEDLNELYLYARNILKKVGYKVFYENYNVFVKKNDTSNVKVSNIQSKSQVDKIKNFNA